MAEAPSPKFIVDFDKPSEVPIVAATGVWGGFAPNGNLIADFFVDRPKNPDRLTFEISAAGQVQEVGRIPQPQEASIYVRRTQVTVVFRVEDARSIGDWFHQQATLAEAVAAATPSERAGNKP